MGLTSEYSDTVEPIADVDAEAATNQHLFGVISGCGVTYDAANMTYDVAAGLILHNGSVVSVAAQANAGTLVADGTNPRWATIYIDSSGVEGLVHGTAAADPSKPETGDNVAIAMVLIEAGQTIANNISVKLDKRVWTHGPVKQYKYKTADQSFTDTTLTTVTATSGNMQFAVAANTDYEVVVDIFYSAVGNSGTDGISLAFTFPASPTYAHVWYWVPYLNSDGTVQISGNSSSHADMTSGTAFFSQPRESSGASQGVTTGWVKLKVIFRNGTTAGNLVLQAGQNTNGAGTTTIAEAYASCEIITAA